MKEYYATKCIEFNENSKNYGASSTNNHQSETYINNLVKKIVQGMTLSTTDLEKILRNLNSIVLKQTTPLR